MNLDNFDLSIQIFNEFIGLSFLQIANEVGLNPALISPKTSVVTVLNKLLLQLDFDKKQASEKCKPMHLSIKTIKLNESGQSKEAMSFEQVNFLKLSEETWETSHLKEKFENSIFLFFVFQYIKNSNQPSDLYFRGVKLWKMPEDILKEDVKDMWSLTYRILNEGVQLEEKPHGKKIITKNNLPGVRDNPVVHIRPKASDGNDKVQLPGGEFITKQAYWINASYISDIVRDLPPLVISDSQFEYASTKKNSEFMKTKGFLSKEVYTIREFLNIAGKNRIFIDELDITASKLYEIGFNLEPGVMVSENIGSLNEYLMEIIFKENYFVIPDSPVFQLNQVKRKISNLQNAHQLIDVGEGIYLTNKNLDKGGLDRATLEDYKQEVLKFVGFHRFYTLDYLIEKGFSHKIEEYGFDPVFYENILKGQGYFKSLRIAGTTVFKRSNETPPVGDFIDFVLGEKQTMGLEEFISCAKQQSGLSLSWKSAMSVIMNSNYFYSEELEKVFRDKEFYYSELFN